MKKIDLHYLKTLTLFVCAWSLFCLPRAGRADNLTTTTSQNAGSTWNAAIWQTNGTGTKVGPPVAGNTYEAVSNGIGFGNGTANTRVRTPTSGAVFPGDSLTLDSQAELRLKNNNYTNTFPGANGHYGLVLNGGILELGNAGNFAITGTINVASRSYIIFNASGGAAASESLDIQGVLSGSGALVLFEDAADIPSPISGNANTFSGQWVIKSAWLLGVGANSLGTNSITVDPNWVVPMPPFDSSLIDVAGPAILQVNYPINSAGTLILTNGGQFINYLQGCCFAAVIVEGTALSAGTHTYAALSSQFPTNFPAGGSGSITVRPYNTAWPPPVMLQAQFLGGTNLLLSWSQGFLLQATNVTGPWTTNLTATPPFTVIPTAQRMFYRVQVE